jgi:hypothetical protein
MSAICILLAGYIGGISAPHAPGCLPAEATQLTGRDGGAATLTLVHELGEQSASLFKSGKVARGNSNVVMGVQRRYAVSFNCAMCLAAYVQCGVTSCDGACRVDFKTSECQSCVASECGEKLLHCTRAGIEFPEHVENLSC